MTWLRTRSGLAVPERMADGGERHPAIPYSEWRTLSSRDREYLHGMGVAPRIAGGATAPTYMVVNGAMPTTAAVAAVTSTTAIKTMLQIKPAIKVRAIEWGISFDGSSAATPGSAELIETDVAATVTAFAAADVMPYSDLAAAVNTAGTSGTPLNLGTTHSGFTSSSEGSTTASRLLDLQKLPPTAPYVKQQPLAREPEVNVAAFGRVRATYAAAINVYCYIIFEV